MESQQLTNKTDNDATQQAPRLAWGVDDFAAAIGIGRSKVYEEIRDRKLRAKKLGARTIITAPDAADYLANLPDMPATDAA
jgi:hypothetical protein